MNEKYRELTFRMGSGASAAAAQVAVTAWLAKLAKQGWDGPYQSYTSTAYTYYHSAIQYGDGLRISPYIDLFFFQDSNGMVYLYIYFYAS